MVRRSAICGALAFASWWLVPASASQWRVTTSEDPMDGTRRVVASTRSGTPIEDTLGRAHRPALVVRCSKSRSGSQRFDLYVSFNSGLFLSTSFRPAIRYRVDEGTVISSVRWQVGAGETAAFHPAPHTLAELLMHGSVFHFDIRAPYGRAPEYTTFSLNGSAAAISSVEAACPVSEEESEEESEMEVEVTGVRPPVSDVGSSQLLEMFLEGRRNGHDRVRHWSLREILMELQNRTDVESQKRRSAIYAGFVEHYREGDPAAEAELLRVVKDEDLRKGVALDVLEDSAADRFPRHAMEQAYLEFLNELDIAASGRLKSTIEQAIDTAEPIGDVARIEYLQRALSEMGNVSEDQ